jgi:hypothetical protein
MPILVILIKIVFATKFFKSWDYVSIRLSHMLNGPLYFLDDIGQVKLIYLWLSIALQIVKWLSGEQ